MNAFRLQRFVGRAFAQYRSLFVLIVFFAMVFSCAGEVSAQPSDSFPKPYVMENEDIGGNKPEINLNKTLGLPGWASIAVQHRTRYETLDHSFRAGSVGGDQIISQRTLAQGELHFSKNFMFKAEMIDARGQLVDKGTYLDTSMIDAADLLEANFQWNTENLFSEGSKSVLRAGRITMDVGDRRLIARNRFRNDINAFTGLDGIWQAGNGNQVRAFYTLPVDRLPNDRPGLASNDGVMDRERLQRRFWGTVFSSPNLPWGYGELFYFNLEEEDAPNFLTQNRRYNIPGMRVALPKKKGRFDYELMSAFIVGKSRGTTAATDVRDLDHFAQFHHAEIGYTFNAPWSPRFLLDYNYASGDADPNDGKNGAFELIFGRGVVDFGPTSINTGIQQNNVSMPGARFQIRPNDNLKAFVSYQAMWLAEKTGPWAVTGLRDITGGSGAFLGHYLISRGGWQALSNLLFEGGIAYRIDSDYQKTVPHSPREGNTTYVYVSTTISF